VSNGIEQAAAFTLILSWTGNAVSTNEIVAVFKTELLIWQRVLAISRYLLSDLGKKC
jgi:hypothetical protein